MNTQMHVDEYHTLDDVHLIRLAREIQEAQELASKESTDEHSLQIIATNMPIDYQYLI